MTESATLQRDVPCFRCGYDLRGLPADGRCPECATRIASSLAAMSRDLRNLDCRFLRRLAIGLLLLLMGMLLWVSPILWQTGVVRWDSPAVAWIFLSGQLLTIAGAYLLSTREIGEPIAPAAPLRRLLAHCTSGYAATFAVTMIFARFGVSTSVAVYFVTCAMAFVVTVLIHCRLRHVIGFGRRRWLARAHLATAVVIPAMALISWISWGSKRVPNVNAFRNWLTVSRPVIGWGNSDLLIPLIRIGGSWPTDAEAWLGVLDFIRLAWVTGLFSVTAVVLLLASRRPRYSTGG